MKQMMIRMRQGATTALQNDPKGEIDRFVEEVSAQYHDGLCALLRTGSAVTVFGSARTKPGHPDYTHAVSTGRMLALSGYAVVTGGGGGIMEAANRGATLAGGNSVGLRIELPFEEAGNAFVPEQVVLAIASKRGVQSGPSGGVGSHLVRCLDTISS